jgi:hypothetical protein
VLLPAANGVMLGSWVCFTWYGCARVYVQSSAAVAGGLWVVVPADITMWVVSTCGGVRLSAHSAKVFLVCLISAWALAAAWAVAG